MTENNYEDVMYHADRILELVVESDFDARHKFHAVKKVGFMYDIAEDIRCMEKVNEEEVTE